MTRTYDIATFEDARGTKMQVSCADSGLVYIRVYDDVERITTIATREGGVRFSTLDVETQRKLGKKLGGKLRETIVATGDGGSVEIRVHESGLTTFFLSGEWGAIDSTHPRRLDEEGKKRARIHTFRRFEQRAAA